MDSPLWMAEERLVSDRCVAVLAGGLSHERDVSLRSGRRLSAALRSAGVTVEDGTPTSSLLARLREHRPDAVVVALHGGEGEGGSIQTVLEMLDVPVRRRRLARVPAGVGQADREDRAGARRARDAGLGGAAAQHVPRARRAAGADRDGRPARAADDAQAGAGWLGAGRAGGARRGGPAGGDGRLPRLLRDRARRAVRRGRRGGGHGDRRAGRARGAAGGGDRSGDAASTTTPPATPPG